MDFSFADDDARRRAVSTRDSAADGAFYVCVRSTGIYCRPSCPARALPENVSFVRTRGEAEAVGMRPCKRCRPDRLAVGSLAERIATVDWSRVTNGLWESGFAPLGRLLGDQECADLKAAYNNPDLFRSTIEMKNHGFGSGQYRYFADPLPPLVLAAREGLYESLLPAARAWAREMACAADYPASHADYRRRCAEAGQTRPTTLLLRYGSGDYNRLHRDLYGGEIFPFQVVILLSEPRRDFWGGELVLTEQRPRMQSRAHVLTMEKGDAVAFSVSDRPVARARGVCRATMRHGVSTVRSGARMALGLIFHDAA